MSRPGPRSLVAALGVLASSACYTYQPIELGEVAPQTEVRARVRAAFAEESAEVLGREERLLEGSVELSGPTELMLLVPVVSALDRRGGTLNQRLAIPRDQIIELELKRRDRTRTALLLGVLGVIGSSLVVAAVTGDERASNDVPDTGPTEDWTIRIPLRLGW